MSLAVTGDLTVTVITNPNHEFLMTTKQVAVGYGVSERNIRKHIALHPEDLVEGKHYFSGVNVPHMGDGTISSGASISTLWTKRGIVRLGFFIKSQRAGMFRDWAEDLVIRAMEPRQKDLFGDPVHQLPAKRRHNRLSPIRLVDILADVALIPDQVLRERLVSKIMWKGGAQ